MELKINDTVVQVPTDLSQIPLGKFVEYWNQYGRDLDKRIVELQEAEYDDEFLRELDLLELEVDDAVAWYSFFTGFDFASIRNQLADELLSNYRLVKDLLRLSEAEQYQWGGTIQWEGKEWSIRHWKVTPGAFILNELLTSKEITRQIHAIGQGRWEAMPYLCAVFFRQVGEPFAEELVDPQGTRMQLLQQLPMSYVMQVAFFLSACVSIFSQISASSSHLEQTMPP